MRSPLSQARGLGSARKGVEHWWVQRVTAVALAPLMLWLSIALIEGVGSSYTTVVSWLRAPLTTVLMVLLLIALFYHTALGLQVIIEDYVHPDRAKIPVLVLVRLACFTLAVVGIIVVLRVAFAS
jgi:succinate dehydrogenase / fumarate reductase membrane anchor subunit